VKPSSPTTPLSPRALERRLKRYVWGRAHAFLAVCPPGLEAVLREEVRALPDVTDLQSVRGGVSFRGPYESLYHANLKLATAHRVLWRIGEVLAQSYPMLFNKARRLPWERFVGFETEVAFHVTARASRLHHGPKIAATLYSALSEALTPLGLRAAYVETAPLTFYARLFRDRCTLSLDTSGEHLHRRGYRTHVGEAPLRETLAAGILLASGAPTFDLVVDPMCGSGTLLIEAARLARRRPPGEFRRFAFEHFPSFRAPLYERLRQAALNPPEPERLPRFYGFDRDAKVLEAAVHNARAAGVAGSVTFTQADVLALPFAPLKAPHERALLVCNPPYGHRLGGGGAFYRRLVTALTPLSGWHVAILTPEPAWLAGLPLTPALRFQHGGLEVTLLTGELASQPPLATTEEKKA
jgi:putative N6-adenine-specific DNA methylase